MHICPGHLCECQRLKLCVFFCCSYLHFLRLGLLLNLELSDSTKLATEIPVSDFRTLGLQLGCYICPAFYVDSGGRDSDSHVCVRQSPLSTELSSQCSYANSKIQMAFSSASHTLCFFLTTMGHNDHGVLPVPYRNTL